MVRFCFHSVIPKSLHIFTFFLASEIPNLMLKSLIRISQHINKSCKPLNRSRMLNAKQLIGIIFIKCKSIYFPTHHNSCERSKYYFHIWFHDYCIQCHYNWKRLWFFMSGIWNDNGRICIHLHFALISRKKKPATHRIYDNRIAICLNSLELCVQPRDAFMRCAWCRAFYHTAENSNCSLFCYSVELNL